jgi:hypothetical protein
VKNNKLNINNLKIPNKSIIRIVNNYQIIIILIKINMDKLSIKVYNLMEKINLQIQHTEHLNKKINNKICLI